MMQSGRLDDDEIYNFYTKIEDRITKKDTLELLKFKNNLYGNNTPLIEAIFKKKHRTFETILQLTKTLKGRNKNKEGPLGFLC